MAEESPRSFEFTEQDFQRIRKMIYDHAGIALGETKRELVYGRLARRLRVHGIKRFGEYLKLLESHTDEWEAFVNSLTTNLTSFFREQYHFPILGEHVASVMHRKPLHLWCAAASTGEEAYSMAITLAEQFNTLKPPVHISATDIDTQVLAKAATGSYRRENVLKMQPKLVERYFQECPDLPGHLRIRPELRAMITFRPLNLLDAAWTIRGPFEAVFCRNVMIYFDKPTQHRILRKFVPVMRKDGLLFAGHSESLYHAQDLFRIRGKTVYEIAEQARSLAAD